MLALADQLRSRVQAARRRFRMNIFTRFVYRGIYVVLCGLIAVILPFFG